MRVFYCEVVESLAVRKLYKVKAENTQDAISKLECGSTMTERKIRNGGVLDRTLDMETFQSGPILVE